MVLHEIVHHLVPAIIKARCPALDDGDKQSVTGIAFRTDSGNIYNNVVREQANNKRLRGLVSSMG